MLIRKDKSCLCCLWMWWSWCDCHPTVAWKQWSSQLQERSVYVQVRDWFCLSCMDYGLLEAVNYYYHFKLLYFWAKIWDFLIFFNYVYIWLIFWEKFVNFFCQKIEKKKLVSSEVCETNTFKTWLCTTFQRKQLQCYQTCMITWAVHLWCTYVRKAF
jgi:hypothetical protein